MSYGSFHVQYGFKNKVKLHVTYVGFIRISLLDLFIIFFVDYFGPRFNTACHKYIWTSHITRFKIGA